MNILDRSVLKIDQWQQRSPLKFPIAVIKKYGDDDASHQAALITYYGFLSLFPLLMVMTSIVGILSLGDKALEADVLKSVSSYFPVLGEQLSRNIQASTKSGAALAVGLVLAFYGARSGAEAFRVALNNLWRIPKQKRQGFPWSTLKSLAMTTLGGTGLLSAALLSASTASLSRLFIFKVLSLLASLILLVPTFYYLFRASVPRDIAPRRSLIGNAITASLVIVVMQAFGAYLVSSQLKTLSPLYGTFALVLGLLFWIYIQAVAVLYTVEATTVKYYNYYPRSISGKTLTTADKKLS